MCTYLYNKINYNIFSYNRQLFAPVRYTRACLKKAFRELRVSVCGKFYPNEGGVAGYGNRMRVKYTANWGLQIAEMIFQTRSNVASRKFVIRLGIYDKNGKSGILHNKKAYVIMPVSKKKRRVHK